MRKTWRDESEWNGETKAFVPRPLSARAIGSFAARSIEPAARARGFTTLALLQQWKSIAGAQVASYTAPDRLIWPRRNPADEDIDKKPQKRPQGATLVLRVDGPRSIEVQYRAQQIMERVNAYFGYRAVVELRILQAPVAKPVQNSASKESPRPAPDLPETVQIEEPRLRQALSRLAVAVSLNDR